jgi:hypothetical protein
MGLDINVNTIKSMYPTHSRVVIVGCGECHLLTLLNLFLLATSVNGCT